MLKATPRRCISLSFWKFAKFKNFYWFELFKNGKNELEMLPPDKIIIWSGFLPTISDRCWASTTVVVDWACCVLIGCFKLMVWRLLNCSVYTGAEGSLCLSVIDERADNDIFSFDSFIIDGREEFASAIGFSDTWCFWLKFDDVLSHDFDLTFLYFIISFVKALEYWDCWNSWSCIGNSYLKCCFFDMVKIYWWDIGHYFYTLLETIYLIVVLKSLVVHLNNWI